MLKQINKSNFLTTPFSAAKDWHFYSVANDDLNKTELNSESPPGEETLIALDYIDYYGNPILNRVCNLALEQQEYDESIYEEGEKKSGCFYGESEPKNDTGTYKRLIYNQVYKAFYNEYKNPLNIFGVEDLDFSLSQMHRYLADNFRMFSFSRKIFGDAIRKKSVTYTDNALDDYVEITDDGYGNLVAKHDLFSRIQEVRKFENDYREGTVDYTCPAPDETTTTTTSTTSTSTTSTTSTSTTSTSTTSTSTTSTSTTSTSTTSTTSTTTPTTTSTTSTSTTSTSTSTTSTSTTSTSTSTTSTTTSTTTTTPPPCDVLVSCDWWDGLDPVSFVHWKQSSTCPEDNPGCQCDTGECNLHDICRSLLIDYTVPIVGINTINGTSDCYEDNASPPPNCIEGTGQNVLSMYEACYLPIMEAIVNYDCGYVFNITESDVQLPCNYNVDIEVIYVGP